MADRQQQQIIAETTDPKAPYLDLAQQDLLLAALTSQQPTVSTATGLSNSAQHSIIPSQPVPATMAQSFDPDFTPEMYDFEAGDDSFDFDNADLGGQMIGALPDDEISEFEQHEKRKADDDDSGDGGDAKRVEGEKGAKKPGRKPLTNEPTTKRKAQNRAAQRAFRERKEKHLKDLETQVTELTKSSEADKHENGVLKAQVERLQSELRDYRKRLSLNSTGMSRSPPLSGMASTKSQQNFNFDFPKFGSLPSSSLLNNQSITPPLSNASPISMQPGQLSRHNSEGRGMSPLTSNGTPQILSRSPSQPTSVDLTNAGNGLANFSASDNMHGFASTLPQMGKSGNDPFGDLFSPSILKTVKQDVPQDGSYFNGITNTNPTDLRLNQAPSAFNANGGDSTAGIPGHRVFRFNSNSIASDSASPSASSLSQWNQNATNSSCGTSPEPSADSPANNTKSPSAANMQSAAASQYSFNNLPSQSPGNGLDLSAFDNNAFSVPQLDSFDPVLFGDYRDTTDNILGAGDFNAGFLDDNLGSAPLDFGSPSNLFGILANSTTTANASTPIPAPSHSLMAEIEKARDGGDDDIATKNDSTQGTNNLISCTNIWNQLQSNPDFQDGKFDLDGLCSELRTKARCSESGLMVDAKHVDSALRKMTNKTPMAVQPNRKLMFEQESWDSVLKKMNAAKQS